MVSSGFATIVNPGQAADLKNTRRGVLWMDILDEFVTSDPRRYEFFHSRPGAKYPDFVFYASASWKASIAPGLTVRWNGFRERNGTCPARCSPDLRIKHILGNYYY